MIFSSLLFLFRFLPVMLLLYFAVPRGWRNAVLFLGSLVFYAWGEPVYVLLMLFSTAVDYTHGRIIQNARAEGKERKARLALLSSVVINLGLLGVFKYTDFVIQSINTVTGLAIPLANLPLPIGISFYTFQTMSYSIDVYRGEAKAQKKMIDFGAYVAMFPQLIAGPIVRYQTVAEELNTRRETPEKFADGIALFMVGRVKRCSWQTTSVCCGIRSRRCRRQNCQQRLPGSARRLLVFRFILIFPDIRIWREVWG